MSQRISAIGAFLLVNIANRLRKSAASVNAVKLSSFFRGLDSFLVTLATAKPMFLLIK